MAKIIAGETLTLKIDGYDLSIKIEDASKSDHILAKVQKSSSPNYKEDQVYQFDRSLLEKD